MLFRGSSKRDSSPFDRTSWTFPTTKRLRGLLIFDILFFSCDFPLLTLSLHPTAKRRRREPVPAQCSILESFCSLSIVAQTAGKCTSGPIESSQEREDVAEHSSGQPRCSLDEDVMIPISLRDMLMQLSLILRLAKSKRWPLVQMPQTTGEARPKKAVMVSGFRS